MVPMSDSYQQLLDATIRHLEELKACGGKYITASPEALAALASPIELPAAPATTPRKPAPPPAVPTAPPVTSSVAAPVAIPAPMTASPPATAHPDPQTKEAAMAGLRARALVCQKCPKLAAARKNVVFGVGDINSPLMFVGEAPGADEDDDRKSVV